ncbi:hypothetical protein VTK56DRAFT_8466 [Thermocarpiscus australiensis]
MDTYTANLALLLSLSLLLFLLSRHQKSKPKLQSQSQSQPPFPRPTRIINPLPFLTVYALAMASDWLQGPHLYPLYRDEHRLDDDILPQASLIPSLFATGFLAAAAAGALAGRLADARGRKRACLVFCGVYAASCLLTAGGVPLIIPTNDVRVLFLGRVLGGVGTSLLFCGFESWLVGEVKRVKGVGAGEAVEEQEEEEELGRLFGVMSALNSLVAIASGVAGEWMVARSGTRKAPFWAAAGVLVVAGGIIWWSWEENYGEMGRTKPDTDGNTQKSRLWTVLSSPQVLALGAASTVFEGSMYLFVFFWTPALKSVQASPGQDLPYGIIFSSFMAATLASSLAFNIITERRLMGHASLLVLILATSAVCFFLSANPKSEQSAFWLFCLFEAAVGMYWPCMGSLKGRFIDDGVRAQVYGALRVPLNIFVVVSLLFTGEGEAYGKVFSVCSTLLLASAGAFWAATATQAPSPRLKPRGKAK